MKKKQFNNTALSAFFTNTGMMIKAGISVEETMLLLAEDPDYGNERTRDCLRQIQREIQAGQTFAAAMETTEMFPAYAVSMVRSAENTGKLEEICYHLGDYYQKEQEVSLSLLAAVRYPIVLLALIAAILIAMILFVFPAFRNVYSNLAGSLAASSFYYMNAAIWICEILLGLILLLLLLLLCGLFFWKQGKKDMVRKALRWWKPFFSVVEGFDLYRFTFSFHLYYSGGNLEEDAFRKAMDAAETEGLRKKLKACLLLMEQGSSFSQAAFRNKLYDPVSSRMLIPAERSGNLDAVLVRIADLLKEKNQERMDRIAGLVEPVLTGLLLISAGIMMVALMVPLIGIMNSIG